VNYATADGSATTASGDYSPTSGTLVIPAGALQGRIAIPVLGDTNFEPNEQFFVNLTNAMNAGIVDSQGVGTILNDDVANFAPIAVNDSYSGSNQAVHALNLLVNDSDPDNDPINVTHVNGTQVAMGTPIALALGRLELVSRNGNVNFHFFPNGQIGTQLFSYTISDGQLSSIATATITLSGLNNPPVANNDTFGASAPLILEDTPFSGNVQANDTDPDGDLLTSVLLTQPSKGSVSMLASGDFTFTPNANANGLTSFTYRLLDGRGGVATGTVSLTITSVNDAPAGTDKTIALTRDPNVADTDMIFGESDFGFLDPLDSPVNILSGIRIASLPAAGSLTLSGVAVAANAIIPAASIQAGLLRYAPAMNGFGTNYSSFDFQIIDNGGTVNGGIDTDPTSNKISFSVSSTDTVGPRITDVRVFSNSWQQTFRNFNDPNFADAANRGFVIPKGVGQSQILPWINLNRIAITFSEDVGASLNLADFSLTGVAGILPNSNSATIPVILSYTYVASIKTVVLSLNQSLEVSRIDVGVFADGVTDVSNNKLWGQWTNGVSTISGQNQLPSDFSFRMNVLPGDVDRDGDVDGLDQSAIANSGNLIFSVTTGLFTQTGSYNAFRDIDGSNAVNANDRLGVQSRVNSRFSQ